MYHVGSYSWSLVVELLAAAAAVMGILQQYIGDTSLSSDLLAEELGDVEWDMLGTNLGFSQSQIREIEGDYPNISRRRIVMFDKWLRKEVNPSWTKIIAALEKMSEQNLADRLTKKYLQCTAEVSPLQQQQQPKVLTC